MTDQQEDENRPREGAGEQGPDAEPDLRSVLLGGARRRAIYSEPASPPERGRVAEAPEDEIAPPYVPPVREGDEPRPQEPEESDERWVDAVRSPESRARDDRKLPPVWPGDEDQPWFRRERGLPPLPEEGEGGQLSPDELPTPLAEFPQRARAFGISAVLPLAIGSVLAPFGTIIGTIGLMANFFLFTRGQDVGALVFRLRVVRENGDVAGFYQMFVRFMASWISLLVLGAGFWAAFSDPERRTWHDKWLGTYVVQDSEVYNTRKRSSSDIAFNWFWVIILLVIAATVMVWLSAPAPTETMPVDTVPAPGDGGETGV